MSGGGRRRTSNFTTEETYQLVDLVKKYKYIIECKQTDKVLWKKKLKIWETIAAEFNANSSKIYREVHVLKKKYENLKKVTKKKFADEKCQLRGTGGRLSQPTIITPLDETIKDIIKLQVEGQGSIYDSDAVIIHNESEVAQGMSADVNLNALYADTEISLASAEVMPEDNNWSQHEPPMVRQPISKQLKVEDLEEASQSSSNNNSGFRGRSNNHRCYISPQSNNTKWLLLADKKMELVEMKKKFIQEEHELKMKNIREWHSIQMEMAKMELEKRKKELDTTNI